MKYYSVFESDSQALIAMSDIHLRGGWYDLDCTYSKGVFYKDIMQPKYKSDLIPLYDDVLQADCTHLSDYFENESINSIVFDPPFLFRKRKSKNEDRMSKRFSYFESFDDLVDMYKKSMYQFNKVLKKHGYLFFKCQDMTDGKFYCTHCEIINFSKQYGFELKDIIIKKVNQNFKEKQNNKIVLQKHIHIGLYLEKNNKFII